MNEKRQRFVEQFLVDNNGAAAARRAGYSAGCAKVTASRLLTDANVSAAIRTGQAKLSADVQITQQLLLNELWNDHQAANAAGHWSASIRAVEVMAKMTGNLVERRDVLTRTLDDMTEDELAAEKAKLEAEIAALKAKK